MKTNDPRYSNYLDVLKEELIPAMGCTEPVAIAFAAAKAREVLGKLPAKVLVEVSGNIIKNVKSVMVPNTGGLRGLGPLLPRELSPVFWVTRCSKTDSSFTAATALWQRAWKTP